MDTSDIILAELRDLRSAFNDNAQSTGERLAALETSMKSIVGNGQPGRITLAEEAIQELQKWRWRMIGITTGAATVVSGVVTTVAWVFKH